MTDLERDLCARGLCLLELALANPKQQKVSERWKEFMLDPEIWETLETLLQWRGRVRQNPGVITVHLQKIAERLARHGMEVQELT